MNKVRLTGLSADIALYLAEHPDATNAELKGVFNTQRYIEQVLRELHFRFGTSPVYQGDTKEARRRLVQKCKEWRDNSGSN